MVTVLLFGRTALRVIWNKAWVRRKAMKFAPARTRQRFRAPKRPRSSTSHEIFHFPKFSVSMTRSLVQQRSGATNSFCDLVPPIESHMRENNPENTAGRNEFTDSEQFGREHPENNKTMLAMNWPNHHGDGITLRQNRSTSHME